MVVDTYTNQITGRKVYLFKFNVFINFISSGANGNKTNMYVFHIFIKLGVSVYSPSICVRIKLKRFKQIYKLGEGDWAK